ncbi:hypothetical protein Syncc8109_2254 [Synechococcus sp. WH 8109]|nr:hypothetical protein Syncc8109_2254 [Synechococcus sp. WH 8109]
MSPFAVPPDYALQFDDANLLSGRFFYAFPLLAWCWDD